MTQQMGADTGLLPDSLYDTQGVMVRRLDLGYQRAGYYANRTKAAYWDGRNNVVEQVSSGVYFYHLSVGE